MKSEIFLDCSVWMLWKESGDSPLVTIYFGEKMDYDFLRNGREQNEFYDICHMLIKLDK